MRDCWELPGWQEVVRDRRLLELTGLTDSLLQDYRIFMIYKNPVNPEILSSCLWICLPP